MIRALMHTDEGKPIVLLGFGPENMRRLQGGEPIRFNLKHLDPSGAETDLPDVDVLIVFDDGTLTTTLLDRVVR